jgi:hypothetical protein
LRKQNALSSGKVSLKIKGLSDTKTARPQWNIIGVSECPPRVANQARDSPMIATLFLVLAAHAALPPHPGGKAAVLLFTRSDCPISNRYAVEIERMYKVYSPRGVEFKLVYPEPGLTAAAMDRHNREYGYSMPSVLDSSHKFVKMARARITPEAAVFVQGREIYLGRIDDWFADWNKARVKPLHHDLQDELDAVLAGATPKYRETKTIGCAIENTR